MTRHSVNKNTRMGLVISLCSNSNHLISLMPPKLSQILDIRELKAIFREERHFLLFNPISTGGGCFPPHAQ